MSSDAVPAGQWRSSRSEDIVCTCMQMCLGMTEAYRYRTFWHAVVP